MSQKLHKKTIGLLVKSFVLVLLILSVNGCGRGRPKEKPPIHIIPDMDNQPKYKAQAVSNFFTDGATMRHPVAGTVARGQLRDDPVYFAGKSKDGKFIEKLPVDVTIPLLTRGRERFNIYCAPCHDVTGSGMGPIIKKGFMPPPTFHSDRLRTVGDGYIYDVLSNGFRNMPAYKTQIPVPDRWAIVAYVRALQQDKNVSTADITENTVNKLK